MLGPVTFDTMLPTLKLPSSLANYMNQMMALCDGTLVKEAALEGASEEYWQQQQRQQHTEPLLNPVPIPVA
jgi:hypothetical protein